ncbi:DUF6876 family protein [Lignipirellula cremea]|uniref:DUF6876 domain-containing protein n=1 Tax=Lignipirellula cremea TaxID=2528010 RepID=A0A518E3C6_9BACT|nr:DUF6876 family protein [Lignipirellula cremea]QDU98598.1 hypothetical protein Pla8534_64690 [Lignipirellula cremea]
MTKTTDSTNTLCESDLRQFTGTIDLYRHGLNRRVCYTDGVRYVAEQGEAFWLIDAICSWIGSQPFRKAAAEDDRIAEMHFWTLEVQEDRTAVLFAKSDSPEEAFITQAIPFTDFPLPRIDIWAAYDGENWTLYLPSEH